MTTTDNQPESPISGSAPLYTKVEPLNVQAHGKLGVKKLDAPFAFAAGLHFAPLLIPEFPAASTSYPIIFAGEEKLPIAVMGINPGENLFFNADGTGRQDIYLPAYIRRFPFIVANDEGAERAVVCLDVGADIVAEGAEMNIFEKNGELSEYGKNCIEFCQRFEDDRVRSMALLEQIKQADLFTTRNSQFQPRDDKGVAQGEPIIVSEFYGIDETKVGELSGDKLIELRNTGALAFIYAHLVSQWHWERLINLQLAKGYLFPPANAA